MGKSKHPLQVRAEKEGTPLIDGNQATFVWLGKTAPQVMGDFNLWGMDNHPPLTLEAVEDDVWAITRPFPRDAYIQYIYTTDPQDHSADVIDPHNKRLVDNGFGGFLASFAMPDFQYNPYTKRAKGIPKGTVSKYQIENGLFLLGGKRDVWLYQPATTQAVPLVLAYDGWDAVYRGKLPQILDNLIAQKIIPPIALVGVQNAKQGRIVEYMMSEAHIGVVLKDILPLAQRHLNLIDIQTQPGAFAVLGASMGGLMALYTGLRLSHIFGKVISHSGAFQFDHAPQTPLLIKSLLDLPPTSLNIWQDVGTQEWLLHTNRTVHQLLTDKGYRVAYREYNSGHNWTAWQVAMVDALRYHFPLA